MYSKFGEKQTKDSFSKGILKHYSNNDINISQNTSDFHWKNNSLLWFSEAHRLHVFTYLLSKAGAAAAPCSALSF